LVPEAVGGVLRVGVVRRWELAGCGLGGCGGGGVGAPGWGGKVCPYRNVLQPRSHEKTSYLTNSVR